MTPKLFIVGFLTSGNSDIAYQRRFWGTHTGWQSTAELLRVIKAVVLRAQDGATSWNQFIEEEAIEIMNNKLPPTGNYPEDSFYSSHTVQPSFFCQEVVLAREHLIREHMPFLYKILCVTLRLPPGNNNKVIEDNNLDPYEEELLVREGIQYESAVTLSTQSKSKKVAATICSMVAFSRNRRINGLQLFNSVRFLGAGITERMDQYFHLLSLTSSRQTALSALRTLSTVDSRELRNAMAIKESSPIGPSICIDNLDMEEQVHNHSVGHRSMMFHGTWGYIHHPNPNLLKSLDPSQLRLSLYYDTLSKVPTMKITLAMFMPSPVEEVHFEAVLKSQIAWVMAQYIAKPAHPGIATNPPPVEKIDPSPPNIQMLKLMEASDNSAIGAGQVIKSVIRQTGLKPEEFASQVQIMDADLATCKNFNSLRSIHTPSCHSNHHLSNLCFLLGASHTMWNISHTILNSHFGNPALTHDLGNGGPLH
ncbi:hypothetical protein PGTUg99_004374 [Puccinia graminis f. sp. tritici]|uniref:DUF6589 domain-containing protein n=1 Tax=Puccinia graminis f. sp. tritici TaxID=56615 RepID=A0A5B0RT91_PUCGR|nr:hypothetical protein PGTUg99_004374 [Puccinia graminis f. sp. tritici]